MKKHPLSSAVAVAGVMAFVSANLQADGGSHHEHKDSIEEIIVSASPLDKNHFDSTRPAAVLSGDQLRQAAAATLGESLKGQLGVASASFGPGVGTPVIRGQQGNRIKVMQDNLATSDAANASADHANAVEALQAERIEILRGPQTLRYGSGAIGGVINIIDNRIPSTVPDELSGAIETRYNSVNEETATVFKLDGGSGNLAWHIDGLYRNSDDVEIPGYADIHGDEHPEDTTNGFIENSDSESKSLTAGMSWVSDDGSFLGFSVSRLENEYGIPAGAHVHEDEHDEDHDDDHDEDHDDDHDEDHDEDHEGEHGHGEENIRIDMEQTRYDVKGQLLSPFAGVEKMTMRLGYVDYEHAELEGEEIGTTFDSEAFEGRVEFVHNSYMNGKARGAFGLQFLDKDFSAVGAEAFIPGSTTQNVGVFLVEEWDFDSWLLEAGARLESTEIDAEGHSSVDFNTHSLSLAGQYRVDDEQRFNLVYSRAQRAPSVEELFSDGVHVATQSYEVGDANLDEETSNNIELGYQYHMTTGGRFLEFDISVFYNDISDFIYRENTGEIREENAVLAYRQQGAEFIGVETKLTIPVYEKDGQTWDVQLFADSVRAELDSGANVPRITPRRLGIQFDYHGDIAGNDFDAKVRYTHVSEQDKPGVNEESTPSYKRLDASLNYRIASGSGAWTVFLRGDNLLDEEIRNASSFLRELAPEPGRGVTIGARYAF
ncbi:TonB-dependent receptor [uncultured Pseudoteredinibacter sp.]|uniref:TonB-dependent receptor n=1 Tax=uncultured Pseudoteredinibacter sp. TaxID=1641701 RepID=UPI002618E3CA|nr:TonB-dependent receptor [uncultured Pseudoteredinibacter sp.]